MKIRSDFVTNSSSSSYCIEINANLKDGRKIGYIANCLDCWDDDLRPYLKLDLKHFSGSSVNSVDDLVKLLENAVHLPEEIDIRCNGCEADADEEYDDEDYIAKKERRMLIFRETLNEAVTDLSQIRSIETIENSCGSGEETNQCVEEELHNIMWGIKQRYPNIDLKTLDTNTELLDYVSGLLKTSGYCANNDPKRFIKDYLKIADDITENSWIIDPISYISAARYDFENKSAIWGNQAYFGNCREANFGGPFDLGKIDLSYLNRTPPADMMVTTVKVKLSEGPRAKTYEYICPIENVKVGDHVMLQWQDGTFEVLEVQHKTVSELSLPFDRYKKVTRVIEKQPNNEQGSGESKSENINTAQPTNEDPAEANLGPYAADNGEIDIITFARLFAEDFLFVPEGSENIVRSKGVLKKLSVHYNTEKAYEHPFWLLNINTIYPIMIKTILELDTAKELQVPAKQVHPQILKAAMDTKFTGLTLLNLMACHMVKVVENFGEQNNYTVVIDQNLIAGIPDAYQYICKFIKYARVYNQKEGAFTVEFATALNLDSPISGYLSPVKGAAKDRVLYTVTVGENEIQTGNHDEFESEPNDKQKEIEAAKEREIKAAKQKEIKAAKQKAIKEKKNKLKAILREFKAKEDEINSKWDGVIKQQKEQYKKEMADLETKISNITQQCEAEKARLHKIPFFMGGKKKACQTIIADLEKNLAVVKADFVRVSNEEQRANEDAEKKRTDERCMLYSSSSGLKAAIAKILKTSNSLTIAEIEKKITSAAKTQSCPVSQIEIIEAIGALKNEDLVIEDDILVRLFQTITGEMTISQIKSIGNFIAYTPDEISKFLKMIEKSGLIARKTQKGRIHFFKPSDAETTSPIDLLNFSIAPEAISTNKKGTINKKHNRSNQTDSGDYNKLRQIEGAIYLDIIANALSTEPMSVSQIRNLHPNLESYTPQRIVALMKLLIQSGIAEKTIIDGRTYYIRA